MGTGLSAGSAGPSRPARPRGVRRYAPILEWLPRYDPRSLVGDAVVGLSVWSCSYQALAYATIAGVPVQYGLSRGVRGPHRICDLGHFPAPDSRAAAAVAAVSAAVVVPIVGASVMNSNAAVGYMAALLSKAVMAGFMVVFSFGIISQERPCFPRQARSPSGSEDWGRS